MLPNAETDYQKMPVSIIKLHIVVSPTVLSI